MDEGWSMENLENILDDMSAKILIGLENGACNIKFQSCQVQIFVADTQVEPLIQNFENLVSDSEILIILESQENQDIQATTLLHTDNKEIPKRPSKNTC